MGKFSPGTLLWGIFCVGVSVFLYGCLQSLSLDSFVNDKDVQEIVQDTIEKSAGTVLIREGTGYVSGLIPGNKKISGLSLGKYYMIEEWVDATTDPTIWFITKDGTLSKTLTEIARATVTEIGGLTNNRQYRVKTAEAVTGNVPYTALNPPDSVQVATNTGGRIKLPGPEDEESFIIYTLTPPTSETPYEIIEVPFTPAGAASKARLSQGGEIITLIGRETITDFIFYGYSIPDGIANFFILRVASDKADSEIPGEGDTGNLNITVNFTLSAGGTTFELDPEDPELITFSKADIFDDDADKIISITLLNADDFDEDSIIWTYNAGQPDEITWEGDTLTIDFADDEYIALLVTGQYTISIEATVDGVVYGSSFELEITK
ncbi:MAG: hypothetical protein FWF55_09485 [Treponema sp.]|nr:hypothetical protein [Treponema sp.]